MTGITDQQIYEMVIESQYWPKEQMRLYQRSQVSQLLRHAKSNVAFYKSRLDCMFQPDGSIDWSKWNKIPILTRDNLHADRASMLASTLPPGHGGTGKLKTSGSTGHRVEVTTSELLTPVSKAHWQRYFDAQNLPTTLRIAQFDFMPDGSPAELEYVEYKPTKSHKWPVLVSIKRNLLPRRKLELLKQFEIDTICDFSNAAEIMARENLRAGFNHKLKFVLGYGMGFSGEQRALIAESFGARCAAPYSSKEGAMMAYPCSHSLDLHICSEACLVEILDDQNRPCKPGEVGNIVITNFFNAAQPIIRYKHGDMAAFSSPCECGRTSPRISEIQGRSDPIFQFPDRELTLIGVYLNDFTDDFGATSYQLAQIGPVNIEMRYISETDASLAKQIDLTSKLRNRIHPDLIMTYRRVPDIPYNTNGKQQRYVREWSKP